jgi:hypothetical protein
MEKNEKNGKRRLTRKNLEKQYMKGTRKRDNYAGYGYTLHQTFVNGIPIEEEREDFQMKNGIIKTNKTRKTFQPPLVKRIQPRVFSVKTERMPISNLGPIIYKPIDSILVYKNRKNRSRPPSSTKSKKPRKKDRGIKIKDKR